MVLRAQMTSEHVHKILPRRWRWWRAILFNIPLALVTVAVIYGILWVVPLHRLIPPYPDFPKLQAKGDLLVAALDRYHTKYGAYPPTLKDAGVAASSKTRWGDWYYTPNGNSFELTLGDYDWDGFVLSWNKTEWALNQ